MQAEESTSQPLKPTRASFIRSLPESMPVAEVIERGREAGLDIKPADIHAARYYMRQAAAQQREKAELASAKSPGVIVFGNRKHETGTALAPIEATTKARPRRAPKPDNGNLENDLRVLVLRLGTEKTRTIIAELEALDLSD